MKELNQDLIGRIDEYSEAIDMQIEKIVREYSEDLDDYVKVVDSVLRQGSEVTDGELQDFAMNLSTLIYYASVGCENLSVRDDISKAIYKESYNNARASLDKGTVADKNTQAELEAMEEHLGNIVYNKSYKILKAKVESAQELLATTKKLITLRIAAIELSRTEVNK